jgi:hypothetical protein
MPMKIIQFFIYSRTFFIASGVGLSSLYCGHFTYLLSSPKANYKTGMSKDEKKTHNDKKQCNVCHLDNNKN